jgi:3-oxoacyl-[acyl-carrier protein] reductase
MTDRIALLTGGSTGIGATVCRALVDDGYEVFVLARRPAAVNSPKVKSIAVDLADARATREAAAEVARQAEVTTVIHNAGAIREKLLPEVTDEDLAVLAQLHVGAAIGIVQAVLPAMRAARYGRIVLVSTRAVLGLAKRTVYSATKAGMIGMARTWALELAADGITVNVVAPGPIAETEMFHAVVPAGSEKMATVANNVPVKRLGTPRDVARAVLFFASPDAGFVTGQTLFVCGGASVGSMSF